MTIRSVVLLSVVMGALAPRAGAQWFRGTFTPPAHEPFDTAALSAPGVVMHVLLEKTIFQVDVLTLDLRFGSTSSAELVRLRDGAASIPSAVDSIAAVAIGATDVVARIRFKRGVSLDRFLDGVMDNLERAREAGIVDQRSYDQIKHDLPVWYAFLTERRIRRDDEMWYRIRGDTLRTIYRDSDGEVLLDQTDVGAHTRLSILGGYFAPKSDFRRGLIASFLREQ